MNAQAERISEARRRKAEAIAAFLYAHRVLPDEALDLDQSGRDAAAGLAGRRSPSVETWVHVVAHLTRLWGDELRPCRVVEVLETRLGVER